MTTAAPAPSARWIALANNTLHVSTTAGRFKKICFNSALEAVRRSSVATACPHQSCTKESRMERPPPPVWSSFQLLRLRTRRLAKLVFSPNPQLDLTNSLTPLWPSNPVQSRSDSQSNLVLALPLSVNRLLKVVLWVFERMSWQ